MAKQRFESHEEASAKFWQIEVKGRKYSVQWGKIGTKGQSKEKEFADAKAAQAGAEKLIAQKTGKGYEAILSAGTSAKKTASIKTAAKKKASKSIQSRKATTRQRAKTVDDKILEKMSEFGIVGCHVRRSNIIAFSAQRADVDDPLEPNPSMFFFYNPTKKKGSQWAARGWHYVTGVHGCACFKPNERWVFIADPGEVYVVGQGDDDDEAAIVKKKRTYFTNVKCICGGHAYAVGIGRKVYRRTKPNVWDQLHTSSMATTSSTAGFNDIDGFSEKEIYACGGVGDLWQFNGKAWHRLKVPQKVCLEKICCASDGKVYITTNANSLVIGRDNSWKIEKQDVRYKVLEEIVCYKDKVLVSSHETVFEVKNNQLVKPQPSIPKMDSYEHMAAGDEILVIAGIQSGCLYDGKSWKKIFDVR